MKAEFDTIAENYSELMKQGMVLKGAGNDHAYFTAYKMYYLRDFIKNADKRIPQKSSKFWTMDAGLELYQERSQILFRMSLCMDLISQLRA